MLTPRHKAPKEATNLLDRNSRDRVGTANLKRHPNWAYEFCLLGIYRIRQRNRNPQARGYQGWRDGNVMLGPLQNRILPHKTKYVLSGKPLQIIYLAHLPGSIHRSQNPPVLSTLGVQLPLPGTKISLLFSIISWDCEGSIVGGEESNL